MHERQAEEAQVADDGAARAFELAVGALSRKERTASELEDWLRARDIPPDDLRAALERLAELGELDDEAFARRYAADKRELRGWGPERIRAALAFRGIDPALAAAAAEGESTADQVARAEALLARRVDPPCDERSCARALGYLARRGYEYEVAYEAVRRARREAA